MTAKRADGFAVGHDDDDEPRGIVLGAAWSLPVILAAANEPQGSDLDLWFDDGGTDE